MDVWVRASMVPRDGRDDGNSLPCSSAGFARFVYTWEGHVIPSWGLEVKVWWLG